MAEVKGTRPAGFRHVLGSACSGARSVSEAVRAARARSPSRRTIAGTGTSLASCGDEQRREGQQKAEHWVDSGQTEVAHGPPLEGEEGDHPEAEQRVRDGGQRRAQVVRNHPVEFGCVEHVDAALDGVRRGIGQRCGGTPGVRDMASMRP